MHLEVLDVYPKISSKSPYRGTTKTSTLPPLYRFDPHSLHSYFCGVNFESEMTSAGSQLYIRVSIRVKVTRFPSYFHSNWVDSQLMPLHISVTLRQNWVGGGGTPFRVKFDSAEIRLWFIVENSHVYLTQFVQYLYIWPQGRRYVFYRFRYAIDKKGHCNVKNFTNGLHADNNHLCVQHINYHCIHKVTL